ncbi:IS3 family transposase [Chitinophaga sancti]|uniref:IS3 family transposase n=1 Tax=Chitinophaga sancti TaxID=1004 RepID=A0A1K1T0N8_9BACT|nr:IS3 family transposase [Chitinophaga sancti]WQD59592.1 IS3 family transposase [Chitinophaga sancti]WQG88275.1 IS3 family transposase [Chitinophaga sancti]SFW90168.1 putative transposase [Chitinophaga sancti]
MSKLKKTAKKSYDPVFKATVALEALSLLSTAEAVAKHHGVNKTQVNLWRNIIKEQAHTLFVKGRVDVYDDKQAIIDEQQQLIGQQALEINTLKKNTVIPPKHRLALIDCNHPTLSIVAQCRLFSIHRSAVYYKPAEESMENLAIMRYLDEQYMSVPFYGARRLKVLLVEVGYKVNVKRIKRLMQTVGWKTAYCTPRTSRPDPISLKYPYLLGGLEVLRPNHVWSIDITYIPMETGFMYCAAVIDWYSRYVVGWGINNQMTAEWCAGIVEDAIEKYGVPEIMNSDQGSQFTSEIYLRVLQKNKIKISMDSKGRAIDNIFVERLWRTLKYENIYLHGYTTPYNLMKGLKRFFLFYNEQRIHQGIGYKRPIELYTGIDLPKPALRAALTKSTAVSSSEILLGRNEYDSILCQSVGLS